MLFLFLSFNNLHLFTRDSTSCLAALIFSSLDIRVVSRDTITSRSRCRMFAIICAAVRETSRLAVVKFLSSSEIVSSNSLMTWQSWVSFSLMILAPDMMFSFSSCAALPDKMAMWFWWSVQIEQMQTWHCEQKNRVISFSWNCCEQNGCRFSSAS